MKLFLVLFAEILLFSSGAVIQQPVELLARIDLLKSDVKSYRDSVVAAIASLEAELGEKTSFIVEKNLDIAEGNIAGVSTTHIFVRTTLEQEQQTACVINLLGFLDGMTELSGYAISNCIGDTNLGKSNQSLAVSDALNKIKEDVNSLVELIIQALIGRNAFTQGDEIIERIETLFAEKRTSLDLDIVDLTSKTDEIKNSLAITFMNLKNCFKDLNESIEQGVVLITGQLPVCKMFEGRGARTALPILPHPSQFFPQLH